MTTHHIFFQGMSLHDYEFQGDTDAPAIDSNSKGMPHGLTAPGILVLVEDPIRLTKQSRGPG